jgi:transcriptional regulator with XRE-family HTH domain
MQIWEKIKMLRLSNNFTQNYVAFYLNITQPAYHKIECGKTKISFDRLTQIAKLYNIEVTEIISSKKD